MNGLTDPFEIFETRRHIALAILASGMALTPRAGQFLGGVAVDRNDLTEKQRSWLERLLGEYTELKAAQEAAAETGGA